MICKFANCPCELLTTSSRGSGITSNLNQSISIPTPIEAGTGPCSCIAGFISLNCLVELPIHLSIHSLIYLCIHLRIYSSFNHLSTICASIYPSTYPSIYTSINLSVIPSTYLSICLSTENIHRSQKRLLPCPSLPIMTLLLNGSTWCDVGVGQNCSRLVKTLPPR